MNLRRRLAAVGAVAALIVSAFVVASLYTQTQAQTGTGNFAIPSLDSRLPQKIGIGTMPVGIRLQKNSLFEITSAYLTPNWLSITVESTGNAPVVLTQASVASVVPPCGTVSGVDVPCLYFKGYNPLTVRPPPSVTTPAATFAVLSNATLIPLKFLPFTSQAPPNLGYRLAPHANVTLTYSGPIILDQVQIGLTQSVQTGPPQTSWPFVVIPGQKYLITVIGGELVAQTVVAAQ